MTVGLSLVPGDVLVDVQSNTVSYIGIKGQRIIWKSVANALESRHPTIKSHFILVPLQRRFAWLPHTGYGQWSRQALDSNPDDSVAIYIDHIKSCIITLDNIPYSGNDVEAEGDDVDAEGETDESMHIYFLLYFLSCHILII